MSAKCISAIPMDMYSGLRSDFQNRNEDAQRDSIVECWAQAADDQRGAFMTLLDLLILLLVAGICGALGQAITGFSRGGCLVSIALGFVGAVLGMWIARSL